MKMKNHGLPKKLIKMGLNQWQNCLVGLGRLAGVIDFPVPPNSNIRKTGGKSVGSYYVSGVRISSSLITCMRREGVRLDQNIRVLDFGCGVARQLLHFTRRYPTPSYYACDIDDSAVGYVRKAYPQVQTAVSKFSPPLPYESDFFDVVYSVSIFSHLSMDDQIPWLRELARVLRPDGWCFLTTIGREGSVFIDVDKDDAGRQLAANGFFYQEYEDWRENVEHQRTLPSTSLLVGIERSYGITMVTADYVRAHWPKAGLVVHAVAEGATDGHDLVILRRA